jgi:hypothetical protein
MFFCVCHWNWWSLLVSCNDGGYVRCLGVKVNPLQSVQTFFSSLVGLFACSLLLFCLVFFVKMFWMLWEQVGGIITPPLLISSGFTPEGQNCQFFSLTSHKPIIFCCFLCSPEMAATKICFAHLCCNKQVGVARASI